MKKRYTHIIWDFNGTVYDDIEAGIVSANRLLSAYGLRTFATVEEYRASFGFPIIDYYRRMGFDFDRTPYDTLAHEWVGYYMEESKRSRVFEGAYQLLDAFHAMGLSQILLSATEREMLKGQLAELSLSDRFDETLGQDTIHGHGKSEIGRAWRARNPEAVPLLIGDTEHDAEVAAAMGVDCVLLACGHQPMETLRRCGALAVFESHTAMLSALDEWLA